MPLKELLIVCVRIAAIALFLYGLQIAPAYYTEMLNQKTEAHWWFSLSVVPACFIIAAIMFFRPQWLVRGGSSGRDQSLRQLRDMDVQEIGIGLVGLFFFCRGLMDAVFWLSYMASLKLFGLTTLALSPNDYGSIISAGFQLICGLTVLIGARGLSNLLGWVRSLGARSEHA